MTEQPQIPPQMLDRGLLKDIADDAKRRYPEEACGFLLEDRFMPVPNRAEHPKLMFQCNEDYELVRAKHKIVALVHSHVNHIAGPSAADMRSQAALDIPWGLVQTDGNRASLPFFWGDSLPVPPLLERDFRHGPSGTDGKGDCYALIKDWFWLERGVRLREGPRDDCWWEYPSGENNLYLDNFLSAGFREVSFNDPQVGDVFLCAIKSKVPNHGAVYLGGGLMMHHVGQRYSQTVPVGPWRKFLRLNIRHKTQEIEK